MIQIEEFFRETNREHLIKQRYSDSAQFIDYLYKTNNIRLTDSDFLELLDLSNNIFPMFAFTAIRTGIKSHNQTKRVEDVWSNLFHQIEILFENKYDTTFVGFLENNPEFSDVKIDNLRPFHNNGDAMIKNGIIFCNNINKRVILKEVITHLNTKKFIDLSRPLDVIMLDDVSSNLEYIGQSITDINDKYGFNLRFKRYHFYNVTELEKSLPPIDDNYIDLFVENAHREYIALNQK